MASFEDQKKKVEMELIDNPKYSSTWADKASYLLLKTGLTVEELGKFDAEQLDMLISVFTSAEKNHEIDIDRFLNPELNASQMQILITGYSHGLTTEQMEKYFDPSIPYVKSNWAISALIEGFDIDKYIDDYDKDQIYEIYAGLKDGVDISQYDNIEIPAEKMAIAHHALYLGLKINFDENKILTI